MHRINIGTLNIQNVLTNQLYLRHVLKNCDILFIQEHWQYSFDKHKLLDINDTHFCQAKAVDDDIDTEVFTKSRRYGGTAVSSIWGRTD